ncbi:hypothetical protein VNI00_008955 [Paramarasmius palmivorus]|uniref:Uncharacterized protein n=1 Tax=Paramarasmius palmivorus TaxID=297713 RepID=A0AAW0CSC9_9AGAR
MARLGDPQTLRHVGCLLSRPVPGSCAGDSDIVLACKGALVALQAYKDYLYPHPFASGGRETLLPGMDADETWGLLRRWFQGLRLWSPCFSGSRPQPVALSTAEWCDEVLRGIFNLVYALIEHYPSSELALSIRASSEFPRIAVQLLFGALTVDPIPLSPAIAVLVHPFWTEGTYAGRHAFTAMKECLRQYSSVDFVSVILARVIASIRKDSMLDDVAETHALVYVLLLLYEVRGERIRTSSSVKWLATCMIRLVEELEEYPLHSALALRVLDTEYVGRLLSLCILFVQEVAGLEGSGGWVLEGLKAGLLRAVVGVGRFGVLEERRSDHMLCLDYSSVLKEDCDRLFAVLVPHLLTPAVRRAVERDMRRTSPEQTSHLGAWDEWSEAVSLVREEADTYKSSAYGLGVHFTLRLDEGFVRHFAHHLLQLRSQLVEELRGLLTEENVVVVDCSQCLGEIRMGDRAEYRGYVFPDVPPGYEERDRVLVDCAKQKAIVWYWFKDSEQGPVLV